MGGVRSNGTTHNNACWVDSGGWANNDTYGWQQVPGQPTGVHGLVKSLTFQQQGVEGAEEKTFQIYISGADSGFNIHLQNGDGTAHSILQRIVSTHNGEMLSAAWGYVLDHDAGIALLIVRNDGPSESGFPAYSYGLVEREHLEFFDEELPAQPES